MLDYTLLMCYISPVLHRRGASSALPGPSPFYAQKRFFTNSLRIRTYESSRSKSFVSRTSKTRVSQFFFFPHLQKKPRGELILLTSFHPGGRDENYPHRGRRARRPLRSSPRPGIQIPRGRSRLRGGGPKRAGNRKARSDLAGRSHARKRWALLSPVDARTRERSAGADGFGSRHRENRNRGASARRFGLFGQRIRSRGVAAARGQPAE